VSSEKGYSLVELLVTMVILSVVVGGLTTVFISGSSAQVRLNERFQSQQNARMALDRLRVDIHCASAAQAQTINTYPGIKLNESSCYPTTPTVSYCVIQTSSNPLRYALVRATGTGATDCTASDTTRVQVAESLTSTNVFTTAPIPQYSLQTVGIDIKVGADAASTTTNAYELTDSIVARNSTRCTTGSTCAVTSVP
jgi:prepilin-type N-terminal cleavage/methylation domain-containing protein